MESDSSGTNYGGSYTITAGVVAFGGASAVYGQVGTDAAANSVIPSATQYSIYNVAAKVTGNAYQTAGATLVSAAPAIVINENGTPSTGNTWTTAPTAYSIWGYQSNGTYFCIDSTGGTKSGTTASPITITCQ
jgi:hypothetical protein